MFVHSSPALQPDHDYEKILAYAINTYTLGEHVAPKWELGKVLKWRPMNVGNLSKPLGPDIDVPSPLEDLQGRNARSVGMYKVHGTTVEAVVGGVFHQFVRLTPFSPSAYLLTSLSRCSRAALSRIVSSILVYSRTCALRVAWRVCTGGSMNMPWRFARRWVDAQGLCCDDRTGT